MRIQSIHYGNLRVPLRTPFKTALRTVDSIDDVVIRIETDTGHCGYGEAPPTVAITGESKESILSALQRHISPGLIGQNIANIAEICTCIQTACQKNTSAKAAAEIAVYDLYAQWHGKPLYQVLGGRTRSLKTDLTISMNDTASMIADCQLAIARGFSALKIKVGTDVAHDAERLKAIYQAVNGRAQLRIDANQAWNAEQTVGLLRELEHAQMFFEFIEQPVAANDVIGMKFIKAHIQTPVLADESAFNLAQVKHMIGMQAADLINIKLMKTGGLSQAIQIADYCAERQIECMMGCMLEGSISVAAAAHFAAAKSHVISKIDLDGPSLCAFNPIDCNVHFNEAEIILDDTPGLGIQSISHVQWLNGL